MNGEKDDDDDDDYDWWRWMNRLLDVRTNERTNISNMYTFRRWWLYVALSTWREVKKYPNPVSFAFPCGYSIFHSTLFQRKAIAKQPATNKWVCVAAAAATTTESLARTLKIFIRLTKLYIFHKTLTCRSNGEGMVRGKWRIILLIPSKQPESKAAEFHPQDWVYWTFTGRLKV